jgi:aminoglycoside phosphotransferase family enzyme
MVRPIFPLPTADDVSATSAPDVGVAPTALEPDLATKVGFLGCPSSYPEPTRQVEARETHMSWVFLTDRHAYKLKKPVRYPFLDFSTIELRRRNCEEEVRLNRRLAPDVYIGVVALALDREGRLSLGAGKPVDWLVKMRRLPAEKTLDYQIKANSVSREDIGALAHRLAAFYRNAAKAEIDAAEYRERFRADIATNEAALHRPGYMLPAPLVEAIAAAQRRYLVAHGERLDRRVHEGRIVEGHGDLRPEHVYLGADPLVTDCLEFNPQLRIIDPADELAYLAIECERDGAPEIGALLLAAYAEASGDSPPSDLVAFYKSYRALLRAKIAISHLDERDPRDSEKWRTRTHGYLGLAQAYLRFFG